MMEAYCGGAPSPALMGRMVIYKALCDLLWTLWGLIQHADGNPVDDFWAYAVNRFERCQKLMRDPAFAGHVAAVTKGCSPRSARRSARRSSGRGSGREGGGL